VRLGGGGQQGEEASPNTEGRPPLIQRRVTLILMVLR
jgi:hypothetical protein